MEKKNISRFFFLLFEQTSFDEDSVSLSGDEMFCFLHRLQRQYLTFDLVVCVEQMKQT